jgi:hypothetical protein
MIIDLLCCRCRCRCLKKAAFRFNLVNEQNIFGKKIEINFRGKLMTFTRKDENWNLFK